MTPPLVRASYDQISLYAPNRAPCAIDLSDNTNTFGLPPAAERAIRDAAVSTITRYPSLYAPALKEALGRYLGVDPSCVVTGSGSDDVLDSAIRAFAEPGDAVAYPDPSFAMIPIFARMNGLEPVAVPLRADLDIDADALLATGARIIYVCSPNNPTGTLASREALRRLLAGAPGVVILDEAYAEFARGEIGAGYAGEAPGMGRVLVVRTMSKAFGLAGLRVGYATGAPALVDAVEKSRGPYKVSALAERAAVAALTDDLAWVSEHVDAFVENRARLEERLRALGLSPVPSAANFVFVPLANAGTIARRMRELGVAVRPFEGMAPVSPALRGTRGAALRISLGPWPMVEECLRVLRQAMTESER